MLFDFIVIYDNIFFNIWEYINLFLNTLYQKFPVMVLSYFKNKKLHDACYILSFSDVKMDCFF